MRPQTPVGGWRALRPGHGGLAARVGLVWSLCLLALAGHCLPAAATSLDDVAGRCPGVLVVVDPGGLGGEPRVGCADDAGRADRVFAAAGVTLTYTQGQPFVCRVDGLPGAAAEDCRGTPPDDAYWGLFWAGPGRDDWTYARYGAASLEVPAGGAVAWRFQDGSAEQVPSVRPGEATPTAEPSAGPPAASEPTSGWVKLAGGALIATLLAAGLWHGLRRDE